MPKKVVWNNILADEIDEFETGLSFWIKYPLSSLFEAVSSSQYELVCNDGSATVVLLRVPAPPTSGLSLSLQNS